jgi:hypothetical protein
MEYILHKLQPEIKVYLQNPPVTTLGAYFSNC